MYNSYHGSKTVHSLSWRTPKNKKAQKAEVCFLGRNSVLSEPQSLLWFINCFCHRTISYIVTGILQIVLVKVKENPVEKS